MKNRALYTTKSISITAFMLLVGMLIISCERENTDPPKITNVRSIEPEEADIPLEGAGLESWIVIQGQNLATTTEIYFNEFYTNFNPAYVSENNIVVQIPGDAPNIGTDPDVPNTVRVVTRYGEAVYDFITYAPPAFIAAMSCEYAQPGDSLLLIGQYFYQVDSVVFPGGFPGEVLWTSNDGAYCLVVVPPEATDPGQIRVVTVGGTRESGFFRDTTSLMKCNFDNINTFIWGCDISSDASSFPGAQGQFAHIHAENLPEDFYEWWAGSRSCNLDSSLWIEPENLGNNISDYVLKFEMYVKEPWQSGGIYVDFTGAWNYQFTVAPWYVNGERTTFITNQWVTAYLPLNLFGLNSGTGANAETLSNLFWENGFARLSFFFMNTADGTPDVPTLPIDNFSVAIDNIRLLYNPN